MKIKIRKQYLKHSYKGKSPIHYHAEQPNGVGTTVHATLHIDPVLRKHPDLRKPMVQHEVDEIRHWGEARKGNSHYHAKRLEPIRTRNLTVNQFWKEVKGK